MDWLGSTAATIMFTLSMLFFLILVIYIRLYVRIIYEGTLYRHYRFGRLLNESDQGGRVLLIPLIDRLEVFGGESNEFDENPDQI